MRSADYNEAIVFIARETGWTLEYIRSIPLAALKSFLAELRYQKAMDEYRAAANTALVICTMANLWSKGKYKTSDFLGEPPMRGKTIEGETELWQLIKELGLRIPKKI